MFPCVLSEELAPVLGFCPPTLPLNPEEEVVLIWLIMGAEADEEAGMHYTINLQPISLFIHLMNTECLPIY